MLSKLLIIGVAAEDDSAFVRPPFQLLSQKADQKIDVFERLYVFEMTRQVLFWLYQFG